MANYQRFLDRIGRDTAGAIAIAYGLMAALISIAAITAMGAVGNALNNTFNYVSAQETAAQSGQL